MMYVNALEGMYGCSRKKSPSEQTLSVSSIWLCVDIENRRCARHSHRHSRTQCVIGFFIVLVGSLYSLGGVYPRVRYFLFAKVYVSITVQLIKGRKCKLIAEVSSLNRMIHTTLWPNAPIHLVFNDCTLSSIFHDVLIFVSPLVLR